MAKKTESKNTDKRTQSKAKSSKPKSKTSTQSKSAGSTKSTKTASKPKPAVKKKKTVAPKVTRRADRNPVTSDDIARRAYELYMARGCTHGHDLDDWLQAEAELRG